MTSDGHLAPSQEYIAILDAGSQFGKVIDRKVRGLRVKTKIMPLSTNVDTLKNDTLLKGVIISGGPKSVHGADAPAFDRTLFSAIEKPVLGICYGMQLLVDCYGGAIVSGHVREDGQDSITVDATCPLFHGLNPVETVLLTHGDSVTDTGPHLRVVATSSAGICSAVQHVSLPLYGVQFHPEVELSLCGLTVLHNFLTECGCSFLFVAEDRETTALRYIRERVTGDQRVVCLVSGGVDSTVCALLLHKALGPERVVCIHVDHGFMRLCETEQVVQALQNCGVHTHVIHAAEQFAKATTKMPPKPQNGHVGYETAPLSLCVDPEEKRSIIGDTFMAVCNDAFRDLGLVDIDSVLLAQGTLRPDLIESGSAHASANSDTIKTHHNDTAVVRQLRNRGRIIEPLSDYHKDEVRQLGVRLGMPRAMVERQPFPGPGLAIRVLCSRGGSTTTQHTELGKSYELAAAEVSRVFAPSGSSESGSETLPVQQGVDDAHTAAAQVRALFYKNDNLISLQLAACVLPVRTVGVQGDGRSYAHPVALSTDKGMPMAESWTKLIQIAKDIPKVAHHINRVVFMFGPKQDTPPSELTPTFLVNDVLDKSRMADATVNAILSKAQLTKALSQVPVVLIPLRFSERGSHSVVIRTFVTNDFMTGVPATPGTDLMPLAVLQEIVAALQELPFVSRVLYDLTAKPPGTTEWE